MSRYSKKDATAMTYDANKRKLRHELALLNAELLNEALSEMTRDFEYALQQDRRVAISLSRQEVIGYLKGAVERLYGPLPRG
jgi:hypothetical protein